jgi:hypothetical protein
MIKAESEVEILEIDGERTIISRPTIIVKNHRSISDEVVFYFPDGKYSYSFSKSDLKAAIENATNVNRLSMTKEADLNINWVIKNIGKEAMTDAAVLAVESIVSDLTDRHELGEFWEGIDYEIQEEIKKDWADIVRAAIANYETVSKDK